MFTLCQGYTPKKVSEGGYSAFSTQSGTPKGGKCRTFFHESARTWGVALTQVRGASGGGGPFKPPIVGDKYYQVVFGCIVPLVLKYTFR